MYQLSGLKISCKGILERDLSPLNVLQVLSQAYEQETIGHSIYDLKEICLQYVDHHYHFLANNNAFNTLPSALENEIYQRYFFSVEQAEGERQEQVKDY